MTKKQHSWMTKVLKIQQANIINLTKEYEKSKNKILKGQLVKENTDYMHKLNQGKTT